MVILPIFGALRGGLWSLFVSDKLLAALIDAAQGMAGGYLMGWYLVRSIGLPRSATSLDYAAAAKARELK